MSKVGPESDNMSEKDLKMMGIKKKVGRDHFKTLNFELIYGHNP